MACISLRVKIAPRQPARAARDRALALIEKRAQSHPQELSETRNAGADVLAWLARCGGTATRAAVAGNPATPADSDLYLASDGSDCVRAALASKIGKREADSNISRSEEARDAASEIIDLLVHDPAACVRAALSDAIKSSCCLPLHVVSTLAHDEDAAVAGPILERSPLLSDEDLLQVIVAGRSRAPLTPIARRVPLSANVSDAIALVLDDNSVAALLANRQANIREQALDHIAAHADAVVSWHGLLAGRTELSPRAIRKVATFAELDVVERLADRRDLDDETRVFLHGELLARSREANEPPRDEASAADAEIRAALEFGKLDDDFIKAAAEAGQRETIVAALAERAVVPRSVARRILASGGGGAMTDLVRRAGLNMRTAFAIQKLATGMPARERRSTSPPRRRALVPWQFRRAGAQT
jgi:uncharacterized protein (DUF2336 family)